MHSPSIESNAFWKLHISVFATTSEIFVFPPIRIISFREAYHILAPYLSVFHSVLQLVYWGCAPLSEFGMLWVWNVLNYSLTSFFFLDMLTIFTRTTIERWVKPLGTLMISRVY